MIKLLCCVNKKKILRKCWLCECVYNLNIDVKQGFTIRYNGGKVNWTCETCLDKI